MKCLWSEVICIVVNKLKVKDVDAGTLSPDAKHGGVV